MERRRAQVIAEVVELVRAELPGVEVQATGEGVVISAPGLWRRRIDDARLRGIAALVKGMTR